MNKFKKGDRVRLTDNVYAYGYMGRKFIQTPIGTMGTVGKIEDMRIGVDYDNASEKFFQRFFASPWKLELITDDQPTNFII